MELLLNKGSFQFFYNNIYAKKKERFEMILEPLQAILQLALLSFCPKGTKITINQNILQLQMPYYTQGILRWYQNDNKDDLFYLFYVCKRFSRFYGHLKQIRVLNINLYDLLIDCAKEGLNNLIQTYANSEKISLLHTLELYKLLLSHPQQFDLIEEERDKDKERINQRNMSNLSQLSNVSNILNATNSELISDLQKDEIKYNDNNNDYNNNERLENNEELQEHQSHQENYLNDIERKSQISDYTIHTHTHTPSLNDMEINSNDIENVFIRITRIYNDYEYNIMLNSLILLQNNELDGTQKEKIINGLNQILEIPTCKINKWIHKNIVF